MKLIVCLILLISSPILFGQSFVLPQNLKNAPYDSVHVYLDRELEKEKTWTNRKIKLTLFKSNWYYRNWDFGNGEEEFLKIPISNVKKFNCEGDYYLTKAIFYKYDNEPKKAAYFFQLAIKIYKIESKTISMLDAMIEQSEFHRKYGQHEIGIFILNKVETAIKKNQSVPLVVKMKLENRKAAILNEISRGEESIGHSKKCIRMAEKLNNLYYQAVSYNELGFSYKNLPFERAKNLDSSILFYQKAEKLFREINLTKEALQVKENWITAYSHNRKKQDQVIQWYKDIEQEVKSKNIDYQLKNVYQNIHTEYLILKDYKNSLKYFVAFHTEHDKDLLSKKDIEISKLESNFKEVQLRDENQQIKKSVLQKEKEINIQRARIRSFIISIALLLFLSVVIFYLFRQKRKLSHSLIEKNKEKDVLIQEIHHRVKNNLHFISTLLDMQQSSRKDMSESIALQEANMRISSLSLVHEMLYKENYLDKIALKNYCNDLMELLKDGFNIRSNEVLFFVEVDDVFLNTHQATSIGLIVNELFNNSVKHAFFKTPSPSFHLKIKSLNDQSILKIEIWDNGPGYKSEIDFQSTFGMKLIELLSRQLKGTSSWETNGRFYFSLMIPV